MSWAADVHRATSCERHRECLSERLSYRPATVAVAQGSGASAGMSRAVSVACAYSPALPANRCVRETLLRQGSSHGFSFVPQAVSAVVAAPAQAGTSARTAPVFVSCSASGMPTGTFSAAFTAAGPTLLDNSSRVARAGTCGTGHASDAGQRIGAAPSWESPFITA